MPKGGQHRNRDMARLEALLAEGGLSLPPMPETAEARLKEREAGCFSTRAFKESPVNLLHFVRKAIGGASPDYALVASAETEPGAVALHYYLVRGILQLFVQVGWGPGRANQPARECLELARELVGAVPGALYGGLLDPGGRLTVVATDRGESFWETASGTGRLLFTSRPSRRKLRNLPGPREVLSECVAWCRGKGEV